MEFRHKDDAEKAIKELHGTEFKGRSIHIREVKPGVHRVYGYSLDHCSCPKSIRD